VTGRRRIASTLITISAEIERSAVTGTVVVQTVAEMGERRESLTTAR
jgi:hypothetical protein